MNDLQNNDIKANAQAGAVNISTNDVSFQPTVNLGINGRGDIASFPARFIRSARKALYPHRGPLVTRRRYGISKRALIADVADNL